MAYIAGRQTTPVFETDLWCKEAGHLNESQARFIASLLAAHQPQTALEIGFATGRSAATLLHHGITITRLFSVDQDLDYMPQGREYLARIQEAFGDRFVFVGGSSQELLAEPGFLVDMFPGWIDFAFVDGDHSQEGCGRDLANIAGHINLGGLILVDDYLSSGPNGQRFPSVDRAVNIFMHNWGYQYEKHVWHCKGKGMAILRRTTKDAS